MDLISGARAAGVHVGVYEGARRASITLIEHLLLLLSESFSPDPSRGKITC